MPEEEKGRFRAAIFPNSTVGTLPVRSLTTTLMCSGGRRKLDVDMFISERREEVSGESTQAPRYLVGLRLNAPFEPDAALCDSGFPDAITWLNGASAVLNHVEHGPSREKVLKQRAVTFNNPSCSNSS